MSPLLNHGDIIIYKKIRNKDKMPLKDSIVIFRNPLNSKEVLIKKVYKTTLFGLDLRGTNIEFSRDSRHFGFVSRTNLLGLVENVIITSFK